jgi:recombination DNA repair RAD52 pathway protein
VNFNHDDAVRLIHCGRPGDRQHLSGGIANPFGESLPRVSTYTAQEIATLQSRLDKQLGPEYVSSRQGPGGAKVHYLAAEKVINLANEVFGFNGWSSAIRDTTIDYVSAKGLWRQTWINVMTVRSGSKWQSINGSLHHCSCHIKRWDIS